MDDTVIVEIPLATRRKKALITLLATLSITGWVVYNAWSHDQLGLQTLFIFPFFSLGIWGTYHYWRTTIITKLTPEGELLKQKAELETQRKKDESARKQAEFEDKWYVRYTIAALFLWGAFDSSIIKPDKEWLSWLAVICAAFFARELSFLLIIGGILYAVFQGMASLPVSVAIIIGACIIAGAIK